MVCPLQMKTADTTHMGIFATVTSLFSRFIGQGLGMRLGLAGVSWKMLDVMQFLSISKQHCDVTIANWKFEMSWTVGQVCLWLRRNVDVDFLAAETKGKDDARFWRMIEAAWK